MCLTICVTHHWQCTLESSSKSTNYDNGILHVTPTHIPTQYAVYCTMLGNVLEVHVETHIHQKNLGCVCVMCVFVQHEVFYYNKSLWLSIHE